MIPRGFFSSVYMLCNFKMYLVKESLYYSIFDSMTCVELDKFKSGKLRVPHIYTDRSQQQLTPTDTVLPDYTKIRHGCPEALSFPCRKRKLYNYVLMGS